MAQVKFYKVATLPGTLEADAFYFVENGTYTESYLTNSAGAARSIGNSAMINSLVNAALASWSGNASALEIVADIAARDALTATLDVNAMILVIDASADATVDSGSALYAYGASTSTVYKLAEYESMDVIIQWSSIQGGPSSTPAQIDSAVSQAHSHTNKSVLDLLSADSEGLTYGGVGVSSRWATNNW
ncbi:hypothetical protein [Stutzerimonas stutzeri]|uniref:Uncharacterized protein n=1 Tax=Stutzerimonas stutzeri KOS6 TaxID=1218352 RepID=A0A061JJT2_STUST|nr:hypothetical protein [Stutzerimonas stutzeri]EWC39546.1 hypothetical protein B597_019340 [Stutzerimonas stutzeri KOS6]